MMTKSTVVDNETGKSVDSTVRTSTGTFFAREQDAVIAAVEKRISMVRQLAAWSSSTAGRHVQAGCKPALSKGTLARSTPSCSRLCKARR